MTDPVAFTEVCSNAREAAQQYLIVMFGVRPTRPATETAISIAGAEIGVAFSPSKRFVEKPDAVDRGKLLLRITCGTPAISCSGLASLLKSTAILSRTVPSLLPSDRIGRQRSSVCASRSRSLRALHGEIDRLCRDGAHHACRRHAVSYGWSDVGSWQSVWELLARDTDGNAAQGSAVFNNARGSYVVAERQLVALSGLDNVVVVATDDAILVARREDGEGLRQVVKRVYGVAPTLTQDHLTVHRPWGSYKSVDLGDQFEVKRIVVKQGGRLSLQMHHHRAEHWIVVRGTARVTIGDNVSVLHENSRFMYLSGRDTVLKIPARSIWN